MFRITLWAILALVLAVAPAAASGPKKAPPPPPAPGGCPATKDDVKAVLEELKLLRKDFNSLESRVTKLEKNDKKQDAEIKAINEKDAEQDGRLDKVESDICYLKSLPPRTVKEYVTVYRCQPTTYIWYGSSCYTYHYGVRHCYRYCPYRKAKCWCDE